MIFYDGDLSIYIYNKKYIDNLFLNKEIYNIMYLSSFNIIIPLYDVIKCCSQHYNKVRRMILCR